MSDEQQGGAMDAVKDLTAKLIQTQGKLQESEQVKQGLEQTCQALTTTIRVLTRMMHP